MWRWMLISVVILFAQEALGAELTRSKAEELLEKWHAKGFSEMCRLAPALAKKQEFVSLKDRQYCKGKVVVTGIQSQSPTVALTEFHYALTMDKAWLQAWLDGIQKLQQRLSNLPVQRSCDITSPFGQQCLHWGHTWKDNVDGSIYGKRPSTISRNEVGTQSPDIRQTLEWAQYEAWKKEIQEQLTRGNSVSAPSQARFEYWDDGWRIATN